MKVGSLANHAPVRLALLTIGYSAVILAAYGMAYLLRFDFSIPPQETGRVIRVIKWLFLLKLALLMVFRQFEGLLSYFSIPDLRRVVYASLSGTAILVVVWFMSAGSLAPPRGVILADLVLSLFGICWFRLSLRLIRERYFSPDRGLTAGRQPKRVGIVGAGDAGAALAREFITRRGLGLLPVVFFDDDRKKWRSRVHQILVAGAPEILLDRGNNFSLDEVVLAMPSASAKRVGEIVKLLQKTKLPFQIVPALGQLATGKLKVSQLRPVQIQDLLGREQVKLEAEAIRGVIEGKVVMVTGAGGSIGSELCRQIAYYKPKQLLLVERSEFLMFQIEQEMVGQGESVVPLIADILDEPRIRWLFENYRPQVVFHSAAHKHVPMMESQPGEAIKNNTLGTILLAKVANEASVERFVMISTDKAVNPTNVMGASKRLAEVFLQSYQASKAVNTKFMAVRFGNVLGSSGSVVPTFQRQIAAGGPITVTHPDVTRFFMTIPEAVGLVLQSATQGKGGEIFVLDMGKPIKIVDLARQIIELSGLRPNEDIEIQFSGLRPGEKLYEELSHNGENITPTAHPKIMRFVCQPLDIESVELLIAEFRKELSLPDPVRLKQLLKKAVPEYQPFLN